MPGFTMNTDNNRNSHSLTTTFTKVRRKRSLISEFNTYRESDPTIFAKCALQTKVKRNIQILSSHFCRFKDDLAQYRQQV